MKKKNLFFIGILIVIIVLIGTILWKKKSEDQNEASNQKVESVTTVSEEEYQFYQSMVLKRTKEESNLDEKTKQYAKEVYAQFALGEQYGLCKPYSFEGLKYDLEAENKQRQAKHDAGEIVYGTLQYEMDEYFDYVRSNLKTSIIDYLALHPEEDMVWQARDYYKKHEEQFQELSAIRYTLNGEEKEVLRENFSMMEKTESDLFQVLLEGSEGDSFQLPDEAMTQGKILEKEYRTADFEDERFEIMKVYIANVYYQELIEEMQKSHQLEFELSQKS